MDQVGEKPLTEEFEEILMRLNFPEDERRFARRVFGGDFERYKNRLEQYGFVGHGRVLDAACGFGQWSMVLSELNNFVEAIDISSKRTEFLDSYAQFKGIPNLSTRESSLVSLPFDGESFDAVFCYGAVFLTDWKKTLREFSRILKRGGLLYLNANDIGWYVDLWERGYDNKYVDQNLKDYVSRVLTNTVNYQKNGLNEEGLDIVITPIELKNEIELLNFSVLAVGPEGTVARSSEKESEGSFFEGSFKGFTAVHELLATKM